MLRASFLIILLFAGFGAALAFYQVSIPNPPSEVLFGHYPFGHSEMKSVISSKSYSEPPSLLDYICRTARRVNLLAKTVSKEALIGIGLLSEDHDDDDVDAARGGVGADLPLGLLPPGSSPTLSMQAARLFEVENDLLSVSSIVAGATNRGLSGSLNLFYDEEQLGLIASELRQHATVPLDVAVEGRMYSIGIDAMGCHFPFTEKPEYMTDKDYERLITACLPPVNIWGTAVINGNLTCSKVPYETYATSGRHAHIPAGGERKEMVIVAKALNSAICVDRSVVDKFCALLNQVGIPVQRAAAAETGPFRGSVSLNISISQLVSVLSALGSDINLVSVATFGQNLSVLTASGPIGESFLEPEDIENLGESSSEEEAGFKMVRSICKMYLQTHLELTSFVEANAVMLAHLERDGRPVTVSLDVAVDWQPERVSGGIPVMSVRSVAGGWGEFGRVDAQPSFSAQIEEEHIVAAIFVNDLAIQLESHACTEGLAMPVHRTMPFTLSDFKFSGGAGGCRPAESTCIIAGKAGISKVPGASKQSEKMSQAEIERMDYDGNIEDSGSGKTFPACGMQLTQLTVYGRWNKLLHQSSFQYSGAESHGGKSAVSVKSAKGLRVFVDKAVSMLDSASESEHAYQGTLRSEASSVFRLFECTRGALGIIAEEVARDPVSRTRVRSMSGSQFTSLVAKVMSKAMIQHSITAAKDVMPFINLRHLDSALAGQYTKIMLQRGVENCLLNANEKIEASSATTQWLGRTINCATAKKCSNYAFSKNLTLNRLASNGALVVADVADVQAALPLNRGVYSLIIDPALGAVSYDCEFLLPSRAAQCFALKPADELLMFPEMYDANVWRFLFCNINFLSEGNVSLVVKNSGVIIDLDSRENFLDLFPEVGCVINDDCDFRIDSAGKNIEVQTTGGEWEIYPIGFYSGPVRRGAASAGCKVTTQLPDSHGKLMQFTSEMESSNGFSVLMGLLCTTNSALGTLTMSGWNLYVRGPRDLSDRSGTGAELSFPIWYIRYASMVAESCPIRYVDLIEAMTREENYSIDVSKNLAASVVRKSLAWRANFIAAQNARVLPPSPVGISEQAAQWLLDEFGLPGEDPSAAGHDGLPIGFSNYRNTDGPTVPHLDGAASDDDGSPLPDFDGASEAPPDDEVGACEDAPVVPGRPRGRPCASTSGSSERAAGSNKL